MNQKKNSMLSISFPIGDDGIENMYATHKFFNLYILENSPFYAYDISYRDVISAVQRNGRLSFDSVVERGGHSTYRAKLLPGRIHEEFLRKFEKMFELGCSYEGSSINNQRLYAIDLPPVVDIAAAYEILENGARDQLWDFEEAHFFSGHRA